MSTDRLLFPIYLLILTFIGGTLGYFALGFYGASTGVIPQPWELMNCAFMTAISLTTVGYGDYLGLDHYPLAMVYTMLLLFVGMGIVLYGVSEATSFLVEGHLGKIVERRRTMKAISSLNRHIIVCGAGDTGQGALSELMTIEEPFIVIENNEETCQKLLERHPKMLLLNGDALDEETLKRAGIERARAVIASLSDDRDTLVCTITVRCLNPSVLIVAGAKSLSVGAKLRAAGANQVVTPTHTGGLRLASEVIRPHVTTFLDTMIRHNDIYRFGEVELSTTTALVGTQLSQAGIRERTGLNIIAVRDTLGSYHYNVDVERNLQAGDVLIAIGTPTMLQSLKELC
ncbi:MAG: NAD-binding protein [Candidatus Hydrogenedentota bacterium]